MHQPYRGITITEAGRVVALKQIRYQRIAEVFLVQVMEMNWLEVFEEALRLSEGLSEAVVERMYEMCGAPATCPHGEPIPDARRAELAAPERCIAVAGQGGPVDPGQPAHHARD